VDNNCERCANQSQRKKCNRDRFQFVLLGTSAQDFDPRWVDWEDAQAHAHWTETAAFLESHSRQQNTSTASLPLAMRFFEWCRDREMDEEAFGTKPVIQ
jgi:hypothetical protein